MPGPSGTGAEPGPVEDPHKKLAAVATAVAALTVGASDAASAQAAEPAAHHVAWEQGQAPGARAGSLTAGIYVRI
ncbi:hypothetical protein [Streptomyces filipinensis]|uniref:hypothetical protein n=1 Tax=Streptomyces filipinensis TaxID=66887 RepID=UPI001E2F1ACF|nr:hypothetical protein [Streptomyces filipinensis]